MSESDLIDLALPPGQCAQRFFVRRIFRNAEFLFHLVDGGERYGYVTAFDDVSLQVSTSDPEPKAILIPWAAIVDIEETGKAFEAQTASLQDKIKSYTRSIRAQAEWNLVGKRRPARVPSFETPGAV